jgi:hypothetical protein
MVELVDLFNNEQETLGKVQIRIGVGIASGRVIAGYTRTQNAPPTPASATQSTSPPGLSRTRRSLADESSSTRRRATASTVRSRSSPRAS